MRLASWLERLLIRATGAFVDLEEGALPDPLVAGCPERLRRMADGLPRDQLLLLHAGGVVIQVLAMIRFGRSFRRLDDERARRLLADLAGSRLKPLRRLCFVLKMMTQYAYFSGEATWAVTGYTGPRPNSTDAEAGPPPRLESGAEA